jgi:hypothetical protein
VIGRQKVTFYSFKTMKKITKNTFYRGVILPALITIVTLTAINFALVDQNLRIIFIQTVITQLFQLAGKPDDQDE